MPRPAGPFAIYGSWQPGATLVLPELEFSRLQWPEIPRRGTRNRQTEVALNGYRLHSSWAISLIIAGSLLLLTGCQGVAGGSTGAGTVGVGSGSLNFGTVPIGSSKTLSDTISNNTSSSVTINSIQGLGSGFQVTGVTLPLLMAAGQTASFSVQYQPTDSGDPTITISFDGPNAQPIVSLSASGNGVTLGKLSPSPSQIAFGNTNVGSNQTSTVTLSNTRETDLTVTQATMSGAGFSMSNLALPLTLHAAATASVTMTFAPTGAGNFSGSVTFATTADGVNSNVVLNFSGAGVTPGTLSPNPSSLAFGSIQVGSNSSKSETLTNTSGATVTISQATPSGAGFSVSGLTLPVTLTANQSVTFNAIFAPASAGAASGTLSIVSDASNSPLNIALSGTGTAAGQLAVSPTSLSFGNVAVGSSASLNGSLNASGASVTVTSASLNNSEFVLSGISLPATLAAGQSTPFTVAFTPQASGATSASLSFSSNAANSPAVQSMTGTGTAPAPHTVDLTWNSSNNAVGYNVYRSTVSGGPYSMINTSLDGTTAYTDNTVVSGQSYYYVATAVGSDLNESGYSNQAQAVIPNP
jgi:hypothetical protein